MMVAGIPKLLLQELRLTIQGDWTGGDLVVGYNYLMEVDFPRMFVNSDNVRGGVTDTSASLTIHRCKLSLGPQGVWSTILKRKGKG